MNPRAGSTLSTAQTADGTLDRVSSARITLIRFPLIVAVVFIHAYASTVHVEQGTLGVAETGFLARYVRDFISGSLAAVAVPLFYLMSGWLLFHGGPWTRETYTRKLRTRMRTLLVPYLVWNAMTVVIIGVAQALPVTARFFSAAAVPVYSMGFAEMLDTVFGITGAPVAYQFWFIKDLMLLVLLAPLIHAAATEAGLAFLGLFAFAWGWEVLPSHVLDTEAVLFFYVGALAAVRGWHPFGLDRYGARMTAAWLALAGADAATRGFDANLPLHKVGLVVGCAAALYWSRALVTGGRKPVFMWLGQASFFVFAAHEPLLTALRKLLYAEIVPTSGAAILALYFVTPLLVIALCLWAYALARISAPNVSAVLVGGR
jgi:surface polysaccharide O-acyltransferase-like enzyme